MSDSQIALLKFNGKPYLSTALHCTGKFSPRSLPPYIFYIESSPEVKDEGKTTKVYRYFKDDLRLTEAQARDEELAVKATSDEDGEEGWAMLRTDIDVDPKEDTEQIPADGSKVAFFSPMHASGFFLANLCQEVIERIRDLFGSEEEIHIHFTSPNYEFEKQDGSRGGKYFSDNYRRNIRTLVDEYIGDEKYDGVQFRLDKNKSKSNFVYEPYAAYHYFSKVEQSVDVRTVKRGTTFLVFDMGGSTTDVAVVQVSGDDDQVFTAYPVSMSVRRAGEYYDRCILKNLLDRSQVTGRGEEKWADVLAEIEQAKIRLCEGESEVERIEIEIDGEQKKKVLDREVLQEALQDVWEKGTSNQRLGRRLRGFLNRAQRQVREHSRQVEFDRIDRVFLAGGSSDLPGIKNLIRQELDAVGLWGGDSEDSDASESEEASDTRFAYPQWRLFNEKEISNSVVVAAGRAAALASGLRRDAPDVEGKEVFVRVVDDDGKPYVFERKDGRPGDEDEEFLLCQVGDVSMDDGLAIETGEPLALKDVRLESGEEAPSTLHAYLRSDVRDYPDDPQVTYTGTFEGDTSAEAWLRMSARLSQANAHVSVKPMVRYWQDAHDYRARMRKDPDGSIPIPLYREAEPEGIHVCVDFGMSNTAVAVHAPDHEMPVGDPTLEVMTLPSWEVSLTDQIDALLPTLPVTQDKALRGIETIHQHLGHRRELDGIARFLRGTYLYAHYAHRQQQDSGRDDTLSVFQGVADALRARGGPDLGPSQLIDEATSTQDLLQYEDRLAAALAEHGVGADLQTIEKTLGGVLPAAPDTEAPDTEAPDTEAPDADDTGADDTDTDDKATDSESTTEDMKSNDVSNTKTNGQMSPDGHWALGMAEWMEGLTGRVTAPLVDQNEQTQQAIDETRKAVENAGQTLEGLSNRVKDVLDEVEKGGEPGFPEEAQKALGSIEKSLGSIVSQLSKLDEKDGSEDKSPSTSARDVKNRIFDEVEDDSSPIFYLSKGEKELDDLESFVEERGFFYPEKTYRKVWGHLHSQDSRLIILAGAPGAGKSTFARLLAEFWNEDVDVSADGDGKPSWQAFWHLESVSPSWFSPDSLLGGKDPLTGVVQLSAFSQFLISAEVHYTRAQLLDASPRMFFGCLDEFNIARPEQYMSNILSKIEAPQKGKNGSQRTIRLQEGQGGVDIELPPNLKLFATINTDVASKVLSPKVLDRAFFVRMTPSLDNLQKVAGMLAKKHKASKFHDKMLKVLPDIDALARAGQSPLGYRALAKSYQYAERLEAMGEDAVTMLNDVLESAFLSKLPGAFSVNDPKGKYSSRLRDENSSLRQLADVGDTLDVIADGLPGQASL